MNLINLTKKAWQIRKAAAARFGVKVMAISWKLCLQLAGEKEMTAEQKERAAELRAFIAAHEEGAERRAARAAKGGLAAEKAAAADAKCAAYRAELAELLA